MLRKKSGETIFLIETILFCKKVKTKIEIRFWMRWGGGIDKVNFIARTGQSIFFGLQIVQSVPKHSVIYCNNIL